MNVRKNLIEIIQSAVGGCSEYWAGLIADALIANGIMLIGKQEAEMLECARASTMKAYGDMRFLEGIAFATDNNFGRKWIPSSEQLPKNFISVLGYVPSLAPFPTVRECYTIGEHFFFPALNGMYSAKAVTHWQPMPDPAKEGETDV